MYHESLHVLFCETFTPPLRDVYHIHTKLVPFLGTSVYVCSPTAISHTTNKRTYTYIHTDLQLDSIITTYTRNQLIIGYVHI